MPERQYRVEITKKHWWVRPPSEVIEGLTRCADGSYTMTCQEEKLRDIRARARRNRYRLTCTDTRFVRGSKYRETYFRDADTVFGMYRCAYCGKLLPKDKITVDHIVPVNESQRSLLARLYLKMEGAGSVNDIENLAGACERCNKSKGSQLSVLWIIKATLGMRPGYWAERRTATVLVLLMVITLGLSYFDGVPGAAGEAFREVFAMADRFIAGAIRQLCHFL